MQIFIVYLNEIEIERVTDALSLTCEDVYHRLVNTEGYDYKIVVVKSTESL